MYGGDGLAVAGIVVGVFGDGELDGVEANAGNVAGVEGVGDELGVEPGLEFGRDLRGRAACAEDFEGDGGASAYGEIGELEHTGGGIEDIGVEGVEVGAGWGPGKACFVEELVPTPVLHRDHGEIGVEVFRRDDVAGEFAEGEAVLERDGQVIDVAFGAGVGGGAGDLETP